MAFPQPSAKTGAKTQRQGSPCCGLQHTTPPGDQITGLRESRRPLRRASTLRTRVRSKVPILRNHRPEPRQPRTASCVTPGIEPHTATPPGDQITGLQESRRPLKRAVVVAGRGCWAKIAILQNHSPEHGLPRTASCATPGIKPCAATPAGDQITSLRESTRPLKRASAVTTRVPSKTRPFAKSLAPTRIHQRRIPRHLQNSL